LIRDTSFGLQTGTIFNYFSKINNFAMGPPSDKGGFIIIRRWQSGAKPNKTTGHLVEEAFTSKMLDRGKRRQPF
jgi:hypothetical protein